MADEPGFSEGQALRHERPLVQSNMVADALIDPDERDRIGPPRAEDVPLPVVVELNLAHVGGLSEADRTFRDE